jgi:hypothetical protein
MRKPSSLACHSFLLFLGLLMSALLACGGGGGGGETGVIPPTTGSVTTTISDPPTCLVPNGSLQNIWVSITRVQAHTSAGAGPNDSGWVDLADLRNNPAQIDLLGLASPDCLPSQLGSSSGIPPGQYQQIRVYLLSNSPGPGEAVPSPNVCGGVGFNCVVTAGGTTQILLVSGEAQTGIQIAPGQISGGSFSVSAGQSIILNIDFDSCSSLVQQGDGQFRLKPVLHAGEISLAGNFISGAVVDYSTKAPIPNAIVLVEQPDPDNPNIDRMISQTTTGPAGSFIICPLPSGNYDVVAAAQTVFTTYNATVTLGVPLGTAMGNIPLIPEIGILPATVNGQISTTNLGGTATASDLNVSALQPAGSLLLTIPSLGNSAPNVASDNGLTAYTLVLPASNALVGVFSLSPSTAYEPPNAGPAVYQLNARAFIPMSFSSNPGSPDCDPSSLPASFGAGTLLLLGPGATATQNFAFTGCE